MTLPAQVALHSILDALQDGRVFRRAFAIALKLIAAGVALAVVLGVFGVLGMAFSIPGSEAKLAGTIVAACVVATGWAALGVLLYHASRIMQMEPTAFMLARIMDSIIRMIGEEYAVVMCGLGVGTLVASLFGAGYLMTQTGIGFVPGFPGALVGSTASGIVLAATCALLAFVGVTSAYLLAEFMGAIFDIAINVRRLVNVNALAVSAVSALPPPISPGGSRCATCGGEISGAELFCTECGTSVKR